MAQIINNYEMMLIAHQSVTDEVISESINTLIEVINANEGQLLTQDDWGRVRTAYPINKQSSPNVPTSIRSHPSLPNSRMGPHFTNKGRGMHILFFQCVPRQVSDPYCTLYCRCLMLD